MGLFEQLNDSAKQNLIPHNLQWEITSACNLRCLHCYQVHRDVYVDDKQTRLVIEGMEAAGILSVVLTGGEPLSHPDFRSLYLKLKQHGFIVTVCTNATLIDQATAALFSDYPPYAVDISVYGSNETAYKNVTGRSAYKAFRLGVDRLRSHGVAFNFKVPLTIKTLRDFKGINELAIQYDVMLSVGTIIYPKLDCDLTPLSERPRIQDTLHYNKLNGGTQQLDSRDKKSRGRLRCAYARGTLTMTTDNEIVFCGMMRTAGYKVDSRETVNLAIKAHREHLAVLEELYMKGACGSCSLAEFCFGCPAQSYLHTGNPQACVEYFRELAMAMIEQEKILPPNRQPI
jgi:radical SAM protein with 4Fe4S-binding SPASM domain